MTTSTYDDFFAVEETSQGEAEETEEAVTPAVHPATMAMVLAEVAAETETPAAPQLPAERERMTRTPGFARVPTTWSGEQGAMMKMLNQIAEARIRADFADLFAVKEEIEQAALRAGANPDSGEMGRPNYAALPESDKENWALLLAVNLTDWWQKAAVYKSEALVSKVLRQEAFTGGYREASGRSTVEDRTQAGHDASIEQYYFAVICSALYDRAAAACKGAELLCQRLKDSTSRM